jgi:hypothetical protein
MIILDTNVISEEMKPAPDAVLHAWLQHQPRASLYTTAVCEAELLHGIALVPVGRRKRDLETAARRVLALLSGRILPFDSAAAPEFAEIMSTRRKLGRPIETLDAQIAAIARARGMSVATRDTGGFTDTGTALINPFVP